MLSTYDDLMYLVVGAIGEASEDVHLLIDLLATATVERIELRGGDNRREEEKAKIVGVQEADEPDCCQSPG